MMTHTPGPWGRNIPPARKYSTIYAGRNTHVARLVTEGLTESEVEANCNLIAAAPDLLSALKLLLTEMELSGNADSKDYGWPIAITKSREAVAKAAGSGS